MKKILLVAAIASTFMSFAEGETAVQEIGITKVTTSRQSVIVAFSYEGVTADKLVKTTNLTVGDELIAYEGTGFKTWKLAEDSDGKLYWGAPIVVNKDGENTLEGEGNPTEDEENPTEDEVNPQEGDAASTLNQAVGTGIWLKRAVPPASAYSFYIYGTPATEKKIEVPAGTTMLIGNPNCSKKSPTIENASQGDVVYIPNDTGFATYTYGANKMWNKGLKEQLVSLPEFEANTGAWYQSKGSNVVKINWEVKGE